MDDFGPQGLYNDNEGSDSPYRELSDAYWDGDAPPDNEGVDTAVQQTQGNSSQRSASPTLLKSAPATVPPTTFRNKQPEARPAQHAPSRPQQALQQNRPDTAPKVTSQPPTNRPGQSAPQQSSNKHTKTSLTNGDRKKLLLKGEPPVVSDRSLPGVEGIVVRSRVSPQTAAPDQEAGPTWLDAIVNIIPSFADELLGFFFIAIGLLSFLTLVNPASGALGSAWSGGLRQAFGVGAFIVSSAILAAGAILLLPKLGIKIHLNWWRIVAGELFLVFLLAYIHIQTRVGLTPEIRQEEAFAGAMEGLGGGLVGWAVQEVIYVLFGDIVSGLILLTMLALSAAAMVGIGRQQTQRGLLILRNSLVAFAWRMEGKPVPRPAIPRQILAQPVDGHTSGNQVELHPSILDVVGDGPQLVELPAIPGRPSIITGDTGAGALITRRAGPGPLRISSLRRADGSLNNERREIKYRFSVKGQLDKKKLRKRGPDLPPLEVLDALDYGHPTEDEINISAQIIEETVEDFGMKVEVVGVKFGPTITQYAVQPFAEVEQGGKKVVQRVRVTRVAALAQDLSLSLATSRVRIQAPVPGTSYIGIEVPNTRPGIVSLRPILETEQFFKFNKAPLAVALGREVDGTAFAADLTTMPHLLIGGTTGSGKSVCLTSLTACLVMNNRPDELQLIMIDPKMVELIRFNGLPHLLGRVEVELDRIIGVLRWATREMDRRYKLMEEAQARNIIVYNQGRKKKERLPYVVILIDELAELMNAYPDETEHLLTRLAQMARATGMHLVVATQRPSIDVVTGLIKANFPARIAFAVASGVDSRVIIDSGGAEDLIGKGDMLYYASDAAGPIRLQGCFASDAELDRMVEFWRTNWKSEEVTEAPWERSLTRAAMLDETDQMLEDAIRIIQREGEASASQLQRKLNVSYPRAGRIIDALYKIGAVGDPQAGGRTRRVLIGPDVDPTNYIVNWRNNH